MHNPFANKVSPENLGLTFENKEPVLPALPNCLPAKIESLRKQANALEAQLNNEIAQIWAFFDDRKDEEAYYQKRVLSYSFLKHVDSVRNPKFQHPNNNKERNFALGRAFEDMLCENLNVSKYPDLTIDDFQNLERMCLVANANDWIVDFLQNCEKQKEFEGVIKGYKFKCRCDFYNREIDYVGDLKTTSATTFSAFKKACIDFGYYTQGVIYSALAQTESIEDFYLIAGVSKKKDVVFIVSMEEEDCDTGNKELDRLLENLTYYGIDSYFKA